MFLRRRATRRRGSSRYPAQTAAFVEPLEARRLLATLYLAPTTIPVGLVGRDYRVDIEGYGPDPTSQGPYTYTTDPASVDGLTFATNGNVLTLSGKPSSSGSFSFTVHVKDGSGDEGHHDFTLVVAKPDHDGINLTIGDQAAALPDARAGVPIGVAMTAAGGNGDYTFTTPSTVDGLTFFPYGDTLTVSGTPTSAGSFPFTVGIKDSAGETSSVPLTLNVGLGLIPAQLQEPVNVLTPGVMGETYRQVISTLGGTGALDYTFPPTVGGLTLTRDGANLVLQGTPTQANSYPFNVSVKDSAGHSTSASFTLHVVSDQVNLNVLTPNGTTTSPTSLAPAKVGESYTQQFQAVGGDGKYTFDLANPDSNLFTLPPPVNGLQFSVKGDTLTLSGTPTNAGTFGFLVAVHDGNGMSSLPQQYYVTVSAAGTALSLAANGDLNLPAGSQNVPYTQTFTAFGGNGSYDFSTDPVTRLPAGLSFHKSGANYVLSGTPLESGTFPIKVVVTSGSEMKDHSYILTVAPPTPLALTRDLLPPLMQGVGVGQFLISNAASAYDPSIVDTFYAYRVTAAGGSGAGYAFSATGLPPGMGMAANGQLTGAPSLAGDFNVNVTVNDSAGHSASRSYVLTVTPSAPFSGNPYFDFSGAIFSPQQMREAYGFNRIVLSGGVIGDGAGQTVALIESSDQSTFVSSIPGLTLDRPDQVSYANSDLARYNTANGLPQFGTVAGGDAPVFVKLDASGGTSYPINTGSNGEFAQDVEVIHALAPMANIVVFILPFDPNLSAFENDAQLAKVYQTAMSFPNNLPDLPAKTRELLKNLAPVSVVSSSVYYQFNESLGDLNQEKMYQAPFPATQPATVVIAAGDTGYFPPAITGPQYPGNSAQVISAAMTQPTITSTGQLLGEIGVSSAGGGPSLYLPQPPWQNGIVDAYGTTTRVAPDVGIMGSFNAGLASLLNGNWFNANGSSAAAPAWSAIMAIINQGRALIGQAPLNGPTQTLPQLYGLPASDFHKVDQLDDGTPVPSNYNDAAGLGTPVTNSLVPGMIGGHDTIRGTVTDGRNGAGLAGWTVFLDANGDGVYQPGLEAGVVTDAAGAYSFLVSPGGDYRVRVQPPSGTALVQKSADPAPIGFAPGADRTAAGVDFLFVLPVQQIALSRSQPAPFVGQAQTITAQLLGPGGVPVAGERVSFRVVSGPNAGATGTLSPADGVSDSQGRVTFTYVGAGGPGTDTIDVTAVVGNNPPVTARIESTFAVAVPPTVVGVQRVGIRYQPTRLVLSFSEALTQASALNLANYRLTAPGRDGRFGTRDDRVIPITGAVYGPNASVTLLPSRLLLLRGRYQLIVNGRPPQGLLGTNGAFLDGAGNGQAGTDFVTVLTRRSLRPPRVALALGAHRTRR